MQFLARFSWVFVIFSLAVGCAHNGQRFDYGARVPASSEDQNDLREMVEGRDAARMHGLLLATAITQRLVSSFDLRLSKYRSDSELSRLLHSKLYCKIQQTRGLYESVESKLDLGLVAAIDSGREAEEWFFEQIYAFANTDVSAAAAMGQLLRHFADKEKDFCGSSDCVSSRLRAEGRLSFSPLDDQAFLEFLNANRKEIAAYAKPNPTDLEPGECFRKSAREPNALTYDWNKRNWIRSNTQPNEFVITYDDGPHREYTEQIMDLWERSGLAKPGFFWLSRNAVPLESVVRDAERRGFPIGLHSERHADLGNLSKAASASSLGRVNREIFGAELRHISAREFPAWKSRTLDREILTAQSTLQAIVQKESPAFDLRRFRLPFGSGIKNTAIGNRLARADMDHFFWAVDSLDWQDKNPASIHQRVLAQMRSSKRGIILFHDVHPQSVKATRLLIDTFKSTEYVPISVTRMVP